jgi:hypothetical protein
VDRTAPEEVISAWLDHIAGHTRLPKLVLLPYLPADGPLADVLRRALARRAGGMVWFGNHARACLAPPGEHASYLRHAMHGKKRKELRRQRKRLAEMGHLVCAPDTTPSNISVAIDDFLALEAAGWKGRAGTAARSREEIANFVARAVSALARERKAQIVRLCIDANAVAALVLLRSGDMAWCWKIAHDEAYARFSPGVQVLLEATEQLLADERISRVDSCATADHPMIDHIWRERLRVADCMFAIAPDGPRAFAAVRTAEAARRALITCIKKVRQRFGKS